MSATGPTADGDAEREYFELIERTFIRLRGAPLLVSPADFQVARDWHRRGIPAEVVCRALEELFAGRRERGARDRVNSLRYCAPAIERAWEEWRSLRAGGRREEAAPIDVAARLEALAAALPPALPEGEELAARLRALDGDAEAVERALGELEREVLAAARARLDEAERRELEERAAAAVAGVAGRLAGAERRRLEGQVLDQLLRRRLELPPLTLFAGG